MGGSTDLTSARLALHQLLLILDRRAHKPLPPLPPLPRSDDTLNPGEVADTLRLTHDQLDNLLSLPITLRPDVTALLDVLRRHAANALRLPNRDEHGSESG